MKPLHSLVTAALLLTGCASDMTPKEKRVEAERKKIVNQVGDVTHSIGAQFGLSPLQRSVLASRAEKIAGSKDPLKTGLKELDRHPKLERKVGEFLDKNDASDVLDKLGRENPELKAKADEILRQNPGLERLLRR